MKYLDETVKLFKEGTPPFAHNICNVDVKKDTKDVSFTLHDNPDTEKFAEEIFNVESLSRPFKLKATLQPANVLLQVE
uniref:Uncharacterized protein n=1 Tax=Pararge aegeria TaxID=116150 RepID=S4PTU1_9NEOP